MKSKNDYNFVTLHSIFVNVCVIIITILVVNVSCDNCESDGEELAPPYYFSYRNNYMKLKLRLTFINMFPDVTYELHKTVTSDREPNENKPKMVKRFYYKKDKPCFSKTYKYEVNYYIKSIFMEMLSNASWCQNITIFEGRIAYTDNEVSPSQYKSYTIACTRSKYCTILINLARDCTDTRNITTTEEPTTDPDNNYSYYSSTSTTNNVSTSPPMNIDTTTIQNMNTDTTTIKITASNTSAEGAHHQPTPDNNVLTYVIPSVIVVCVIILMIYIGVKKFCRQHSQPEETLELNTYATAADIVYADLNLVHGGSSPPRRDEGSTYAQIIGVMRPVETLKNK